MIHNDCLVQRARPCRDLGASLFIPGPARMTTQDRVRKGPGAIAECQRGSCRLVNAPAHAWPSCTISATLSVRVASRSALSIRPMGAWPGGGLSEAEVELEEALVVEENE